MDSSVIDMKTRGRRRVDCAPRAGVVPWAAAFEALYRQHATRLYNLASRMSSGANEAEDLLQDIFLLAYRKVGSYRGESSLGTWLYRLAMNHCLDVLRNRQTRMGQVTDSMDEPDAAPLAAPGPALSAVSRIDLERAIGALPPACRAAFLLHDVFDVDFAAVALTLDRSESATRQLAARAREHVRQSAPRFAPPPDEGRRLAERFEQAVLAGDIVGLSSFLAEDVVFYSDGGGKRNAALNPIYGRDKVLRFMLGTARKRGPVSADNFRVAVVNGMPGFILRDADGTIETIALELDVAGGLHIKALYATRNPDKLAHLRWPTPSVPKADLT